VELAKLQCGVAAVYQNNWIQPVLCKVSEYKDFDRDFIYQKADAGINKKTSAVLDLKQYAVNNANIDKVRLREKIEALDIAAFKTMEPGFIASLFKNNGKAFKDAIKTATKEKTGLPGLKNNLVRQIEPSLSDYKTDYAEHILSCIVLENCRKDPELQNLPEIWTDYLLTLRRGSIIAVNWVNYMNGKGTDRFI
jgi:hypothetical protein